MKRLTKMLALLLAAPMLMMNSIANFQVDAQSTQSADTLWANFVTPPDESKSRPLWFWNSDGNSLSNITKAGIREIMVNSKEKSGYFGFGILPNWLQNYMSDQYLDLYGYALKTAEELGMKMCLYDENGFPSGSAGGILAQMYPADTMKRLDKGEKDITGPGQVTVAIPTGEYRTYLGAVAMNTDTYETIDISDKAIFMDEKAPGIYGSSAHPPIEENKYTADQAFDGSYTTRWNAGQGLTTDQWLEIRYNQDTTVNKVVIREDMNRITSFAVQYFDGKNWVNITSGTTIGDLKEITFSSVTARRFRLLIPTASDLPSIREMELFNGTAKHPTPSASEDNFDRVVWDAPAGNWKVMTFATVKDGYDRVDYLNKESVDHLIDTTHEVYYENFSKYFGTVIDSAFYDEPMLYQASGRTWTGKFNDMFEDKYGYDPLTLYPALWYDMGEKTASARNALFGFRTELFSQNYIKNMNDWCNVHNIVMTGHMDQEENVNPVTSSGDLMKIFSTQDIPGVDEISYYDRAKKAYKIVSSSANNWDKGRVMTEVYGAMGEDMGIPTMYKDIMNQFAKGINYVVPHAIWYNNKSGVTFPPELSYRSAKYGPELPKYNNYIGRVSGLLQNGRHVADIGVLYPIDTLQAGTRFDQGDPYKGGVTPKEADYMEVGDLLSTKIRKDFTFLHPEIIAEKCIVSGDTFKLKNEVNYEDYKVLVMPGAKTISLAALKKMKAFYDAGGKVIATTQLPYKSTQAGHDKEVVDIITEMFGITENDINAESKLSYSASSVFQNNPGYGAAMAFDGMASDDSRWNAGDQSGGDQWLQVDFGETVSVNKAVIKENLPYRVSAYRIQYWNGSGWIDCASGASIGESKTVSFDTVSTNKLRLYIDKIKSDSVSIQEFEAYGSGGNNLARPKNITADNTNDSGGRAVFLGNEYTASLGKSLDEMLPVADVEIGEVPALTGGDITYIHKVKENRDIFFVANSSDNAIKTTVSLRGAIYKPMIWNPNTGTKTSAEYEVITVGDEQVTKVNLNIPKVQSLFIVESVSQTELDKSLLKQAIDKAEGIERKLDSYVDDTRKTGFIEALEDAKNVYADTASTQAEVTEAQQKLLDAMLSLRFRADKSTLENLVKEADKIVRDKYTEATVKAFDAALKKARTILEDNALSADEQDVVDKAKDELKAAIGNLKLKSEGSDIPSNNNNSPKTGGDNLKVLLTALGLISVVAEDS
ncbi:MAG: hypothetical protein K0R90_162 [Oscillospiraceae bacterium]|nr:hypothetical protein [Oscillospiraceae bacterium]